jgi:3-hydroxyisobutyrate dehydrogenase
VGGDEAILEGVRPVLSAMSKDIVYLGPGGSGARMKLINNFLAGVQVASLAEALAWIERSGLNRDQALNVLKNGAPGSPLVAAISSRMLEAKYDVNFLLSLMDKDLRYAAADAASVGVELRTSHSAEARFAEAIHAGYGDKDMSAVVEPVRKR